MSKGKYKRKREHTQQHAEEQAPEIVLLKQSQDAEQANARKATGQEEKEPLMRWPESFRRVWKRLRDLWGKCSLTDRIIAGFTGVLAAAAIYQFVIMAQQLDTMRKDERPWMRIDFALPDVQVNQPVKGTMHVVNEGKTPAREVRGDIAVERVANGEEPKLDYAYPHGRFSTGLFFPNVPKDIPLSRLRMMPDGTAQDDPLTQSEFDDLQQRRMFFVVYATVYYKDFYGTDHWTRLCAFWVPSNVPGTFTAQKCTDYGDVDTN